jgi:hypothetical protein
MPRHRIEAPRQRTLWRTAEQSARRVRFRAAGRREIPSHAKPAVAPEWRQRLTRNQRRRLKRAGRRLLVSPWFAAGAGVVIATGAIIYTPHATFDFGNAIHVIHCPQAQCAPVTAQGGAPGLPAGIGGGPVTASPRTISVTAGMSFWYQVLDRTQSGFIMQITITASHSLGPWRLSFVIPGATGVYVPDARWKPSGTNGGTASNYFSGTESSDYAPISGYQSGGAAGSSRYGYTVQFQVRGSGTPGVPTHCFYDGVACQFRQAPTAWATSWPSSR